MQCSRREYIYIWFCRITNVSTRISIIWFVLLSNDIKSNDKVRKVTNLLTSWGLNNVCYIPSDILKYVFMNRNIISCNFVQLLFNLSLLFPWPIRQYWFRWWLGTERGVSHHPTHVNHCLWCHITSPGHNMNHMNSYIEYENYSSNFGLQYVKPILKEYKPTTELFWYQSCLK